MTVQARHTFVDGAHLMGAQLANCAHCGTLRVIDPPRHAEPRYVRPMSSAESSEHGRAVMRDSFECPPCVSLAFRDEETRARVRSMNAARRREQAAAEAIRSAPTVAPAPEPAPQKMLPHFPWYADMGSKR